MRLIRRVRDVFLICALQYEELDRQSSEMSSALSKARVDVVDARADAASTHQQLETARHTIARLQLALKQVRHCCRSGVYLSFTPSDEVLLFLRSKRAQKGLAQPQACRAGDISAAPCLQVAVG